MNCIQPHAVFGSELCSVQNPSSYIGGEIGAIVKAHEAGDRLFNMGIAFPDVYSIGMSNQAIKIIYNGLNRYDDIRCERVFAVETDFEDLLHRKHIPLYTLETGMPLAELDMLGFSIGYELGITGVLSILDLGGIPLLKHERKESDPIIIAGGCGATNPAAFSAFFDAVFIGEAEGGMFELIEELAALKRAGAGRSELLQAFARSPHVWTEGMSQEGCGHSLAHRAVYADFGREPSIPSFMPLPNNKPVQDHGVVEIMRGCPNGCRFCHAGIYYRPQRVKARKYIYQDVDRLVHEAGYREISLTSLSSADYPDIGNLLADLNERYKGQSVSFQLPSLKVNSFTLPILESLAEVRKSGLTFAVETPDEAWQLRLNKEVYAQHLIEIILEAKKRGWNKAKFYFMVGLPFPETEEHTEEKAIVDFLIDLQEKTHIQCNVNVGTFIPKPHTPYQWIRQLSPEEAERKLTYIREHLPRGKFKVSTHDIETSFLEGLVSRGDSRASMVIYNAYKKGCRLDAWEDHLRKNLPLWKEAFEEAGYDVRHEILRERQLDEALPWDSVSLGPAKSFYKREWEKNLAEILTPKCMEHCDHRCGICNNKVESHIYNVSECMKKDTDVSKDDYKSIHAVTPSLQREQCNIPLMYRAVFSFSKQDGAEFISHLGQVEIFNRAVLKSGLPVIYTAGFNPLPRLEFATTLSLGIQSCEEIASLVLYDPMSADDFMEALNPHFVRGIHINRCFIFPVTNLRRRESLSSGLWGSEYEYSFFGVTATDLQQFLSSDCCAPFLQEDSLCDIKPSGDYMLSVKLPFPNDRPFRDALEEFFGKKIWSLAQIRKLHTFAKPGVSGLLPSGFTGMELPASPLSAASAGVYAISYFDLYDRIAAVNAQLMAERNLQVEKGAGKKNAATGC